MNFPENLYYSKEHTWLKVDGTTGTIGITEFAQSELGEIVYVELPNVGQTFKADEIFGSVEAVKTTSDLFIPVSGNIIAKNDALLKNPELVNSDPFVAAWIIKIEIDEPSEINNLLNATNYQNLIGI
ncbi:glycine cleavage system H protein [Arcticibacter tournemirensis]|uniref:Glycine cleavage system H protein n=1 Tax=Arcticibacter tournemirensis TaxID=699437 RepID=A0A5M9HF33_9SPHI|nr:glycine cleavage system protein GcvH [Arcticibacter tournemirensis]KAA8485592.1 glycine cleavage system protein GcvH [Arcticibacter tournemirensis]TQM48690.1 glycine cleavage system H protein [Arcticibacter tournemirensis]